MFNTELGRASNQSNSSLAGGSTPAVGSLFWLANQSGSLNQTAPHAMSEWRGYGPAYNVTIYSRAGAAPSISYDLYYSPDNTNWTLLSAGLISTTCASIGTVSISSGTIYIKVIDDNANQVYIRGANSSTCPANLDVTCVYSRSVTAASDVAITVYVDGVGAYRVCT